MGGSGPRGSAGAGYGWDPPFRQDSLEWYTKKCRQTGPTPASGIKLVQFKLNMDDDDDDDEVILGNTM